MIICNVVDDEAKVAYADVPNGMQSLLALLKKTNNVTTKQYTLGAVAAMSSFERNAVDIGKYGGIPILGELLQSGDLELIQRASGTIWNLCIYDENKEVMSQDPEFVKLLVSTMGSTDDEEVKSNLSVALGALASDRMK